MSKQRWIRYAMVSLCLAAALATQDAAAWERNRGASAACDKVVPAITSGYGADGPYAMEQQAVIQKDYSEPVLVFLPKERTEPSPVMFFTHGYGPNYWQAYEMLIRHAVSRGMVVVFAPYPMVGVTMDERYGMVWNGMVAASERYGARMDLSRVAFVGHSFGGGATPAMAYKGIVGKGWGANGAFVMELAPWYSYQVSNDQLQQFPNHVLHAVQVYESDSLNDHRMAIDLFRAMGTTVNLFMFVRSPTIQDCAMTADHSLPGRSESRAVKQYGLFRPLDALADAAFNPATTGRKALAALLSPPNDSGYDPITFQRDPVPIQPEDFYAFPWNGSKNPRAGAR